MSRYKEIDWQYCLAGIDEMGNSDGVEDWKPCLIAGILSFPDDEIYLPYEQAEKYVEIFSVQTSITRILVTVQGEKNHKKQWNTWEWNKTHFLLRHMV